MLWRDVLDDMRARSHQERQHIAATTSVVIVGILFVGWVALFARNIEMQVAALQAPDAAEVPLVAQYATSKRDEPSADSHTIQVVQIDGQ